MTAAALGDLNHALTRLPVDAQVPEQRTGARTEAHLGIKELDALRALDLVAPPEAADLAEPLVALYQGTPTSGDHLRLEQRTNHSGPAIRAAVARVLSADITAVAGNQDAVIKEAKMRRVLQALDGAVADIQRRAALTTRD